MSTTSMRRMVMLVPAGAATIASTRLGVATKCANAVHRASYVAEGLSTIRRAGSGGEQYISEPRSIGAPPEISTLKLTLARSEAARPPGYEAGRVGCYAKLGVCARTLFL